MHQVHVECKVVFHFDSLCIFVHEDSTADTPERFQVPLLLQARGGGLVRPRSVDNLLCTV